MTILPEITKRSYRCYWDNGKTEKAFGNQYEAVQDTLFLALNKWNEFNDLGDYLTHVFGYLKFYGHNAKKIKNLEINCDPIKLEWFALKFNRIVVDKDDIGDERSLVLTLQCLPKLESQIISMYLIDRWSHQEIAETLGLNAADVAAKYRKALKSLRMRMR